MEPYSLTLDEACHFLKISRPTAINWIRTGRLQATRKDPTKNKSPRNQRLYPLPEPHLNSTLRQPYCYSESN